MSVEDRLRRGLEANAVAFLPEGEARLAVVHRRHRARTGVLAACSVAAVVAVVVAATVAGALLSGPDRSRSTEPVQQPSPVVTPGNAYPGHRIPDSNWRKVVTRAELVAAGASQQFLADNLGDADRMATTLSFIGTVYSQSGRSHGTWTVGDAGTISYDSQRRLLLTSTAPGCRGCLMRLDWNVDGNRLALTGFRGTPDDPIARVMLEGTWTRIAS